MLRSRRFTIGLAVSALFLVLLLRQVDRGELSTALRATRPGWLVVAAVPYVVALWLRALRWRIILRPSIAISGSEAFALVLAGYAANNVLPARAGEIVRAGLLQRRHGSAWSLGLGTIVVERVVDGLVLSAVLAATVALAGGSGLLRGLTLLAGIGFVAALLLLRLLVVRPQTGVSWSRRLLRLAPARLRPSLEGAVGGLIEGLTTLRGARLWAAVTALTALSWFCEGATYWLVGVASGLDVPAPLYGAVLAASNLALVVPSTAGGVGPFEFFASAVAVAYGATAAAGAAYAIVLHAFTLVPVVFVGMAILWRRDTGLRALLGAGETTAAGPE